MGGTDLPMLRTILAPNPSAMTLEGTICFIVGRENPVVIDPGPADEAHLAAVESLLSGRRPAAILLTHAHADHSAAAPALAERTGARLLMGRGAIGSAWLEPSLSGWLSEGDEVQTDAGPVRAIATPGHSPEHFAFYWRGEPATDSGSLFVGDLLMGSGDTTLIAPPEGDLSDYLASLDRVGEIGASVLFPAHGSAITEPERVIARYLTHRRERIEQVAEALRATPSAEPEQLVDAVYGPGLDPALRAAAAGSILAIIRFLDNRGALDARHRKS
jgi:glyoxylase-like metal-dependent hydrolase (beta-lactamase superfamily II)